MNPAQLLARATARHSLFWLVAANAVGVWLAAALLWPALGDLLAPLSYGRWMPLHLNWQLYGWCALPLVGMLLHAAVDVRHPTMLRQAHTVLGAWTVALAVGGLSWLAGQTSGKLFLDWAGPARALLPSAMIGLWTVLAAHTWWRRREFTKVETSWRIALLAALAFVPPLFFLSTDRAFYPAVNPDSGGATGTSLLGSTMVVVTLAALLPIALRRKRRTRAAFFWSALGLSWVVFAALDHGAVSHHRWSQILGLALLIAWVPMLSRHWQGYDWPAATAPWLRATFVWWLLLVATGWLSFLPEISERLKFTHGLVAHAHLAMAGLVTSANMLILVTLGAGSFTRRSFLLWQGASAAHILVLFLIGAGEIWAPAGFFRGDAWVDIGYAARLLAGLAMLVASVQWWRAVKQ